MIVTDMETVSAVVAARGEDADTLRLQLASAIVEIAALQQQVADLEAQLARQSPPTGSARPATPVIIN